MVDAAAATGCDAIKIQTYTADTITMDVDRPEFRIHGGLWDGRSLYELYQEAQTPFEWHAAIFERAAKRAGVTLFSSPFDETAVDLLAALDAPAYKIASLRGRRPAADPLRRGPGQAADHLDRHGQPGRDRGRPRHGAGRRRAGRGACCTACPAIRRPSPTPTCAPSADMAARFDCPVGLSDHTLGTAASVAAVAMGACVIEKHFTLARADGGPDAAFSLEPAEFKALVDDYQGRLGGAGPGSLRRAGLRARLAAVPPLAVRHRRREGGRAADASQCAFDPAGQRPGAGASRRGAGPARPRATSPAASRWPGTCWLRSRPCPPRNGLRRPAARYLLSAIT